jgi:hypothetical protein
VGRVFTKMLTISSGSVAFTRTAAYGPLNALTHLVARFSSLKESDRLRVIGSIVLVLGIVGACFFYWIEARPAGPTMDELMPGYDRARTREIGILMGPTGVMLTELEDQLERPGTQALLIAAGSALLASYFFRAAWVLDDDERDRQARPAPTGLGPRKTPR